MISTLRLGIALLLVPVLLTQPLAAPAARPATPALAFHVLGDTHISPRWSTTTAHLGAALQDLAALDNADPGPNAAALVLNGDLTDHGTLADYAQLNSVLVANPRPPLTYLVMGNHEYFARSGVAADKQRYLNHALGVENVYYTRLVNGYRFVFLAGEDVLPAEYARRSHPWTAVLSEAQLTWLDAQLGDPATRDRPTFVFLHQPPENALPRERLEAVLRAHPNTVFIWSHWHTTLRAADSRLFTNVGGYWRMHTGATAYLWDYRGGRQVRLPSGNEGLRVEVYADLGRYRIEVRGRDFERHQWISQFTKTIVLPPPVAQSQPATKATTKPAAKATTKPAAKPSATPARPRRAR